MYSWTSPEQGTLPAGTTVEVIARDAFVYVSAPVRFAAGDKSPGTKYNTGDGDGDGDEATADTSAEDDAKADEDNDGFLSAELVRDLGDSDKGKGQKVVLILRREYEMLRRTPTAANTDNVWVDNPNQVICPSRVHNQDWVYTDMQKMTISQGGIPFVWVKKVSASTPPKPAVEGYIRASSLHFNTQKSDTGSCLVGYIYYYVTCIYKLQ